MMNHCPLNIVHHLFYQFVVVTLMTPDEIEPPFFPFLHSCVSFNAVKAIFATSNPTLESPHDNII
jgi:hypothetical protein